MHFPRAWLFQDFMQYNQMMINPTEENHYTCRDTNNETQLNIHSPIILVFKEQMDFELIFGTWNCPFIVCMNWYCTSSCHLYKHIITNFVPYLAMKHRYQQISQINLMCWRLLYKLILFHLIIHNFCWEIKCFLYGWIQNWSNLFLCISLTRK